RGGEDMAKQIGAGLARAGVTVVSGGAIGIDGHSHRGALLADGPTLAVLGCGIDVAYPPSHRTLLREIVEAGALVSEYPPRVHAEPFRFPARNRIIAWLVEGLVVVEGAEGSGSLITTKHALELGRDVFAVPGSVTSLATERGRPGAVPGTRAAHVVRHFPAPDDGVAPVSAPDPDEIATSDAELIEAFVNHLEHERRLSPNTVAAYRRDVEALAVFQTRSHVTLAEATHQSLRRFVAQQATRGYARASMAR